MGTASEMQLHMRLPADSAEHFEQVRGHLKRVMEGSETRTLLGRTEITNPMVIRYALGRCAEILATESAGGD